MNLLEQLQKMSGIPASKKIMIEFDIDELAFIAGAIRYLTDENKRDKKEFLKIAKCSGAQLRASMIFAKISTRCEKDFRERAEELMNANKEIE